MIIALTGLKQSGKSTAAKYLEKKYGYTRINFKDALIEEIKRYLPDFIASEASRHNVTVEQLFDEKPGSIRQLLQNFGTELRRSENSDYWVYKWARKVGLTTNVVVDDCRFLNEAATVHSLKGVIIKIVKEGQESGDKHSSETEMSSITYDHLIVAENGKPELIEEAIDNFIKRCTIEV